MALRWKAADGRVSGRIPSFDEIEAGASDGFEWGGLGFRV